MLYSLTIFYQSIYLKIMYVNYFSLTIVYNSNMPLTMDIFKIFQLLPKFSYILWALSTYGQASCAAPSTSVSQAVRLRT